MVGVVLGAALVVAAAEVSIQRFAPIPPRILEVDDGVEMLEREDPEILVLGSSHTRSFVPVREALAKEGVRMTLVPVEWGTFHSYEWVLSQRLARIVDERDASGKLLRPSLSRFLLITTFFDLCTAEVGKHGDSPNLPARAWAARHFFADAAADGVDDFNRNYLTTRFTRALGFSVLVQNHGHDFIFDALSDRFRTPEAREELNQASAERARVNMEHQYDYCDDPHEHAALETMIDWMVARGIEVDLVMFPLMPSIVSPKSKETTLARYERRIAELAGRKPIRVVDMTLDAPLVDADFQRDRDHLNAGGNAKFSAWALEHGLSFLRQHGTRRSDGGGPR